ncbi:hypothetical protein [Helicobacter sp. 11S02629-2]|uniref:hypothetical protein n=1 Tax=Helicobacter sp. 11S02629-2 TaxID=1476195 RepID=UPI000BA63AEC|nr:hypothetical protein [Helicobacter sp. 11S02629-2]PAF43125.1 hypothetical protein BKH40_07375 [Helicobacter sp. 11S02629-2]
MNNDFKVFASSFLEEMKTDLGMNKKWSWTPANKDSFYIVASGSPTNATVSTYVEEKDQHSSTDRPNEGMMVG